MNLLTLGIAILSGILGVGLLVFLAILATSEAMRLPSCPYPRIMVRYEIGDNWHCTDVESYLEDLATPPTQRARR